MGELRHLLLRECQPYNILLIIFLLPENAMFSRENICRERLHRHALLFAACALEPLLVPQLSLLTQKQWCSLTCTGMLASNVKRQLPLALAFALSLCAFSVCSVLGQVCGTLQQEFADVS